MKSTMGGPGLSVTSVVGVNLNPDQLSFFLDLIGFCQQIQIQLKLIYLKHP